jgi:urease subunit alpha
MIAYAAMGDPNASIPTPQPVLYRPMFAPATAHSTSITFVSAAALDDDVPHQLGLRTRVEAVRAVRQLAKTDMVNNAALPHIAVDPATYAVYADGEHLTSEPVTVRPMAQRYFLF